MGTFSALLAICAGNSPVTGDFPAHRPVTRSFDVFFDLRLNKGLSKQWRSWWFETPSRPLWRHGNGMPRGMSLGYFLHVLGIQSSSRDSFEDRAAVHEISVRLPDLHLSCGDLTHAFTKYDCQLKTPNTLHYQQSYYFENKGTTSSLQLRRKGFWNAIKETRRNWPNPISIISIPVHFRPTRGYISNIE